MKNHFDEHYEWDGNGVLKKKRVARQGDTISFPMTAMDHAASFSRTFSDGTLDHTNPHQPGYRFADVDDAARIASEQAYRERSARMAEAWRHKGEKQQQDDDNQDAAPRRTPTLDELQKASDAAYREKCGRLDYRSRRHST